MKKIIIFLLIIVVTFGENKENYSPKVGLVLSGGAAKGFAHIGTLKVLEKNNIKIDYISGTSIGALIGVFYSAGYSIEEIEDIMKNIDPSMFFTDKIDRKDLPMEEKIFSERYTFSVPLKNFKIDLPQSLISGQNVYMFLKKYLWDAKKIKNFEDLPIPVHIITTNMNTGEEVVLSKGDLAKALSASMALPAFFHPIKWDDKVLADGLSANNFPVDEVKKMGADIVIGVNITAPLADMKDLNFITVLNQLQYFRSYDNTKESKKRANILIEPSTDKYFPLDFSKSEELVKIGEEATQNKVEEIINEVPTKNNSSRNSIIKGNNSFVFVDKIEIKGLEKLDSSFVLKVIKKEPPFEINSQELEDIIKRLYAFKFFKRIYYEFSENTLILTFEEKTTDKINVGFNYKNIDGNNEGRASIGLELNSLLIKNNKLNFDAVISGNPEVTLKNYIYYGRGIFGKIGLLSTLTYREQSVYENIKDNKALTDNESYKADFLIGSIMGKKNLFGFGINYEKLNYEDFFDKENNAEFYSKWTYDSYDKTVFPDKGTYLKTIWSVDLSNVSKEEPYNNFDLYFNNYAPLNKKLSLITSLNLSKVTGENIPFSKYPLIKGMVESGQEFSFYGLDSKGLRTKDNLLLQFGLKYNIKDNLFVTSVFNSGVYSDYLTSDTKQISGYGLILGRNTDFGPIYLGYSNSQGDSHIYLNFGYEF